MFYLSYTCTESYPAILFQVYVIYIYICYDSLHVAIFVRISLFKISRLK